MSKTKFDIPYKCYYKIFAISSSLKDYRVSYFINNALNISLKKVDSLIIDNKKKSEVYSFELQFDDSSDSIFDFYLINNKTIGKQLITSLKGFDYLFLLKSESEITDFDKFYFKLKEIDPFQIIHDVEKLSKKDNSLIEQNILYKEEDKNKPNKNN